MFQALFNRHIPQVIMLNFTKIIFSDSTGCQRETRFRRLASTYPDVYVGRDNSGNYELLCDRQVFILQAVLLCNQTEQAFYSIAYRQSHESPSEERMKPLTQMVTFCGH